MPRHKDDDHSLWKKTVGELRDEGELKPDELVRFYRIEGEEAVAIIGDRRPRWLRKRMEDHALVGLMLGDTLFTPSEDA